jgi:hypothetical protein
MSLGQNEKRQNAQDELHMGRDEKDNVTRTSCTVPKSAATLAPCGCIKIFRLCDSRINRFAMRVFFVVFLALSRSLVDTLRINYYSSLGQVFDRVNLKNGLFQTHFDANDYSDIVQ